jgi:RNA polymerase sigma-70 factor (ECF subfamily)
MKIARNRSLNRWEARKAAKRGGGEADVLLGELEGCIPSSNTTEQLHEVSLTTAAINHFLAKADKTARVAFVLRYFHGESIAALAIRFNMTESKVKSILFRQRKKLRAHLEREGITV